jgi:hypothetical protein
MKSRWASHPSVPMPRATELSTVEMAECAGNAEARDVIVGVDLPDADDRIQLSRATVVAGSWSLLESAGTRRLPAPPGADDRRPLRTAQLERVGPENRCRGVSGKP